MPVGHIRISLEHSLQVGPQIFLHLIPQIRQGFGILRHKDQNVFADLGRIRQHRQEILVEPVIFQKCPTEKNDLHMVQVHVLSILLLVALHGLVEASAGHILLAPAVLFAVSGGNLRQILKFVDQPAAILRFVQSDQHGKTPVLQLNDRTSGEIQPNAKAQYPRRQGPLRPLSSPAGSQQSPQKRNQQIDRCQIPEKPLQKGGKGLRVQIASVGDSVYQNTAEQQNPLFHGNSTPQDAFAPELFHTLATVIHAAADQGEQREKPDAHHEGILPVEKTAGKGYHAHQGHCRKLQLRHGNPPEHSQQNFVENREEQTSEENCRARRPARLFRGDNISREQQHLTEGKHQKDQVGTLENISRRGGDHGKLLLGRHIRDCQKQHQKEGNQHQPEQHLVNSRPALHSPGHTVDRQNQPQERNEPEALLHQKRPLDQRAEEIQRVSAQQHIVETVESDQQAVRCLGDTASGAGQKGLLPA